MKKNFLLALGLSLIGFTSQAQVRITDTGSLISFKKSNEFTENVSGSQYENEAFKAANVNEGNQFFMIRYNNYKDLMEYQKDNKTTLDLIPEHNKLVKFNNEEVYVHKTYPIEDNKTKDGYLKIIKADEKASLYSYTKVKYNPARTAANSYGVNTPASFTKDKTRYILEVGDKLYAVSKPKDVRKILSNKEDEIKAYLKKNDVEFDNKKSTVEFIRFINSIL